jgi:DHA2 family multidrug resistance protein-like MFS transporter
MMDKNIITSHIAIVAVLLCLMMTVLTGSIVNVALPTMAEHFNINSSLSIWIVNSYQLVITMFILVFAAIGELYGYKRIFCIGTTIFTISSIFCILSPNFITLVISRIIQGLGAACVMGVNPALIRIIYPSNLLGRGLALNAMVIAVSAAAGPTLAGAILSFASWHWLFAINILPGIAALLIGIRFLPSNPHSDSHPKFDIISAICNVILFGLVIYTVESVSTIHHKLDLCFYLLLAIIIAVYYFNRLKKSINPILPIDLLKTPIFTLSVVTSLASYTAQMLALVSLPFLIHNFLGYDEVITALLLTPWPLAILIAAPLAGRIIDKLQPSVICGIGMIIFVIGLFFILILPSHPSIIDIAWRIFICGIGFGFFQTPNNVMIIESAPTKRSGAAGGMLGMARLSGQTLGTALVALLFHYFADKSGINLSIITAIIFAALGGILSFCRTKKSIKN